MLGGILIAGCASSSASWMQDSNIDNKKIADLTIPGSHIANAYKIDKNGILCKGEILPQSYTTNAQIQFQLNNESNSANKQSLFIERLNTQDNTIITQLNKGVRYLDLQVCKQDNQFYTANLYLTEDFTAIADQINTFLSSNPGEIVILDFDNNLRSESGYMNQAEMSKFHDYLDKSFGLKIVPKSKMFTPIGELQRQHYQLILMSSNPGFNSYPDIWDKDQVANAADAQSATIKQLSLLEAVLNGNTPLAADKLNILPIYSEMQMEDLVADNEDNEADQAILMNYLQQNIGNRPGIFVANKADALFLENLIVKRGINDSSTSNVVVQDVTAESAVVIANESGSMTVESNTNVPQAPESGVLSTPFN